MTYGYPFLYSLLCSTSSSLAVIFDSSSSLSILKMAPGLSYSSAGLFWFKLMLSEPLILIFKALSLSFLGFNFTGVLNSLTTEDLCISNLSYSGTRGLIMSVFYKALEAVINLACYYISLSSFSEMLYSSSEFLHENTFILAIDCLLLLGSRQNLNFPLHVDFGLIYSSLSL